MIERDAPDDFQGDTSREALRVQIAALRRMSVAERLRMMDHLTLLARSITIEGLRRRHPGATDEEIQYRFAELTLGKELAARVREHRRSREKHAAP